MGGSQLGFRSVRVAAECSKLEAEWPKVLLILPADLPPGQWSGSWFNRKTVPVGCKEVHAAHKGAFCFSSPHGSSTLLGNSLATDIISLCTEWKKEYLSAPALPSLSPFSSSLLFSLSLSLAASLSVCGALLSLLLRAIYAKGKRVDVRLCNPAPSFSEAQKTRVCLSSEGALLRLNPSPPGNQEVGGPDREGSSGSTQAVSRWMNGSLSGAWERMGRGSRVPTIGIRQREHDRQALQLSTQRRWAYTLWIFAHCLWDLRPSVSTEETGRALCWIGLLHRTQPLFAHRHTNPPGSCLFPLTDISDRRIYVKKKTHTHSTSRARKERWIKGFFSLKSHPRCYRSSP